MAKIIVDKSDIPLWSGAGGGIVLIANVSNPDAPLIPGDSPLLDASFQVDSGQNLALGTADSVAIGVKAGTRFRLVPAWKDHSGDAADLISEYGLADALTDENLLLVFQLGADASLSAAGSFRYCMLRAGVTLAAGEDASLAYVRSFPRTQHLAPMVVDFFGAMRLPAGVTLPPAEGELVVLEYGGYLKFSINASAGYALKGTRSFDIAELKLSEHYKASVVGKLILNANLAGRFSVEVRKGFKPGWARVTVRRKRTKELKFASDLSVGASLDTQGFPRSGKEFLGALIGVRARNWLNLVDSVADEAGKFRDIEDFKSRLDGLAGDFISKYAGKAIDQLLPPEAAALLDRLRKVVKSYRNLGQSTIALFDRYFDPVLDMTAELRSRLQDLRRLASWDQLKGEIDPVLWNVVRQLTDGDPLGWMLGLIPGTKIPSLDAFQQRVDDALALIQSKPHQEIRAFIKLAKSEFNLDHFMDVLESIDTPDKLKTALSTETRHFVNRLINQQIEKLNGKDLEKAFEIVQRVVKARNDFWAKFDSILEDAAGQAFSLKINRAYSAANERTALIDLDIRLLDDNNRPIAAGQRFMRAAADGDFQNVLANWQPEIVRLRKGALTHNVTRESALKINIAGWHRNFRYLEMYRVVIDADQQIRPTDTGRLNVFTTIDMTDRKEIRRKGTKSEEGMQSNFMLRFLGETHGVIRDGGFDEADQSYAIEVITGRSASYEVTFTDSHTTPEELDDAMKFALQLGLDRVGATVEGVAPILELKDGNYGPIAAEYKVLFTEAGLRRLFEKETKAEDIRSILRVIVLGNYFGKGSISDVAWLYSSDDVNRLWENNRGNFIDADSILGDALQSGEVRVESPIPGIHPGRVSNTMEIRSLVAALFQVEAGIIEAFEALQRVVQSPTPISLKDFRQVLAKFGDVLNSFDQSSMGDNTTFAVFDGLIRLHSPEAEARSSSMALTVSPGGQKRHVTFLLEAGFA